jgi:YfiR/HmsC-like
MRASRADRLAGAAIAALALLVASPARGGEALPAQVQASVFRRIFAYDPALREVPRVKVLVVHGRLSAARAADVAAAFEAEGISATAVDVEVAGAVADGAAVLYALADVPAEPLAELARGRRLLTISGDADSAEKGRVAVALRRRAGGQPEILVHLPRLATDGHELSARLLKLATVLP